MERGELNMTQQIWKGILTLAATIGVFLSGAGCLIVLCLHSEQLGNALIIGGWIISGICLGILAILVAIELSRDIRNMKVKNTIDGSHTR